MENVRVLIVEDEAVIALLIETTLKKYGWQVSGIATTGQQAIDSALADPPDLILMDIKLQGRMLGTEAAKIITEKNDVPIVFLTAHSDPDTRKEALLAAPYGYLLKPFKAESLIAAIESAFENFKKQIEIREREAMLKAVFNSSSLGIIVVTDDLKVIDINSVALKMAAFSGEGAAGKLLTEIFAFENEFDLKHLSEKVSTPVDVSFQKEDGSVAWCSLETHVLEPVANRPKMTSLLLRDITHEKRLALLLSLVNRAIETVDVGIVITDPTGEILFVNSTQAEMHGYKKAELVGLKSSSLGAPELSQELPPILADDYYRESINVRKDGSRFPVKLVSSVVNSHSGGVEAIVTACEDISVRRESEKKLQESEEKHRALAAELQSLLDGIEDSICLLSLDFELVWVNNSTKRVFNNEYSPGVNDPDLIRGVVGCPREKLCKVLPEDCDGCAAGTTRRTEHSSEKLQIGADKAIKRVTFPYFDSDGKMSGIIQMARDVTEQESLKREAELTSRMTSLGVMAASMGHEINNPNGVIMANAELVRKLLADLMPYLEKHVEPDVRIENLCYDEMSNILVDSADKIVESSKRIKKYVETIRDFSVPTKGRLQEKVDLEEVIKKALELIKPTIDKFTSHFKVVTDESSAVVIGNAQKLEQIIVNLLLNAAQALQGPNKGIVLGLSAGRDPGFVVLYVNDEGVGIPQEQLDSIRLPFFSTKESEGGSGLGLAIVDRIVLEHKGEMSINSRLGVGTDISIQFPLADPE